MSGLATFLLCVPGSPLEALWRVNPDAHARLAQLGRWAVALMVVVSLACGLAALGLWTDAWWGWRLAVGLLVVNLIGDVVNALVFGDLRTLVGVPIAVAMIVFVLRSQRTRHGRATPPRGGTLDGAVPR
jgi:hypothetical protein